MLLFVLSTSKIPFDLSCLNICISVSDLCIPLHGAGVLWEIFS